MDTEKPVNAGFTGKFPINGWPSFLVIDPRKEKSVFIWPGSVTARELERLFEDGLIAYGGGGGAAERALVAGDRLGAEKKWGEAAAEYHKAIAAGGRDWQRRPRAVESLVMALTSSNQRQACAEAAIQEAPALAPGQSFANAVNLGFDCALSAKDAPWRKQALDKLGGLAEQAVRAPGVLADDRSALYQALITYSRNEEKNDGKAKKLAAGWLSFLEEEVAGAWTAAQRQALDTHLVQAGRATGEMKRVLPELEASEREFPAEYMPSYSLARAYAELGRAGDALAAYGRAIAKAYGPNKGNLYLLRSALEEKNGDRAAARKSAEEGLAYVKTLPESEAKAVTGRLSKRLAELNAKAR